MKIFKTLLFTLVSYSSLSFGQILEVTNMKDIRKHFDNATNDTLAVFDVDMVLIQPKDPAFQMANMKRYSPIAKKVSAQLPKGKKEVFLGLMTVSSDSILVDPAMPTFIKTLQDKKVSTMALTANLTGKFLHIPSMEKWRIECLKQLGINFSENAPFSKEIVFHDLPTFRGNHSVFMEGALFVNGSSCAKGDAFVVFLKKTGYSPKKIIFVDDREDNLKSLETALQEFNPAIEYTGLLFSGAKDYPSTVITEKEFETRWQDLAKQAEIID